MRAPRLAPLLLALAALAPAPAMAQSADAMAESFRRLIESIPAPRLDGLGLSRAGTIAMEGEGSVRVRPDTARLRIGVASEGAAAAEVAQDNARRMGAVLDAVKAASGEAALASQAVMLRTEAVVVTPLYAGEPGPRRPAIRGYRAQNGVAVTVRDLERREPGFLGALIEAATKAGANEVSGPEFSVRDDAKPLVEARVAAIEAARVKAETYAKALNVRLGRVLAVTEGERGPRPMAMAARAAGPGESAPPIEAGTSEVAARVTVVWEIRQD